VIVPVLLATLVRVVLIVRMVIGKTVAIIINAQSVQAVRPIQMARSHLPAVIMVSARFRTVPAHVDLDGLVQVVTLVL
jgi:hypothetical protein